MTKWDKFKDEVNEIIEKKHAVAVVDGKPHDCSDTKCLDCDFGEGKNCEAELLEWLQEEYIEPCPFKKDELVEVSDDMKYWQIRYFSHMENGFYVCFYGQLNSKTNCSEPYKWNYCRKYGTLGGLVKENKNV